MSLKKPVVKKKFLDEEKLRRQVDLRVTMLTKCSQFSTITTTRTKILEIRDIQIKDRFDQVSDSETLILLENFYRLLEYYTDTQTHTHTNCKICLELA